MLLIFLLLNIKVNKRGMQNKETKKQSSYDSKYYLDNYESLYTLSITNKEQFFASEAVRLLSWSNMFTSAFNNKFKEGESAWFCGGTLNACYNAVDRHALSAPDSVALLYDGNDGESVSYTYRQVLAEVCRVADFYVQQGLKKGDCVALYMPMCPEAVFSTLACARLGIVHNVVFGGFSAESLALRLDDSDACWVVTVDKAKRGKTKIDFLYNAKVAVGMSKTVKGVLVFDIGGHSEQHGGQNAEQHRDYSMQVPVFYWSAWEKKTVTVPCVDVDSEHPLFYLYTSGSTGKPKGIVHSTAGYLLYAALTTKVCFDFREGDVFGCTADLGWITGHSYSMYGPMLLGGTTVLFGGLPTFPTPFRLFEVAEKYGLTHLYTAPTVIRMLQKVYEESLLKGMNEYSVKSIRQNYSLSKLRILGTVGEPINKEAYEWYSLYFGDDKLPIIDTYWQTEAGGVMVSPIPTVTKRKPECACVPFFGMVPVVAKRDCDPLNVVEAGVNEMGPLIFKGGWPGVARGIIKNRDRFLEAYFNKFPGFYYTGDEAFKDKDGYVWIRGRADDVLNVSGHRLSTAEIESAACSDEDIVEAAVVAEEDPITGQALCMFIVTKGVMDREEVIKKLRHTLRNRIGPIIHLKKVFFVEELPKTRTGKVMRRVLRSLLVNDAIGDISTCANSEAIEKIKLSIVQ